MKKIHTLALNIVLLSLIVNPICNADGMTPSDILKTAVGVTVAGSSIIMGGLYFIHNNTQHTELEKARMLIQAEEQKQAKRKKQFHTIKRIKELADAFKELQEKNPRVEAHPDKVQQEILEKMRLLKGSATYFEQEVAHLTQACNELDPEIAQEHQEVLTTLSWIRQSVHSNPLVSKQKNTEWKAHLAKEKEKAEARTIQLGEKIANDNAQAAEQHLMNSKKCGKLVATAKSTINKSRLELKTQIEESFKKLNQLSDAKYDMIVNLLASMESDNRNEHRKTRDDVYASEQRINKKIDEKFAKMEQLIAYIAQELASIKCLLLPTPSAPPAHTLPAQNPPAQNPDYIPGVPPHVPQG